MLSIRYPKKYQDEASRQGKKFKYFRVEPVEIKSPEKPKEIKIGKGSGRIEHLKENILAESFSEIIDNYLLELGAEYGSGSNTTSE